MFPLSDIRGRVLGFGARATGEEQRPKYLNTSDNDVYHKGLHLYGANLARAHAARAGQVILCEGYTDTIALHQAGMRNAVGLMGTALTGDQVGELARMAQTVLLALDADSAGQEAMLRASTLAEKRKLELRVVPLPEGTDPADLLQREGREAMEAAVARSVPFVRFRVERTLDRGDHASPEGRDRMIEELRPVFATLAPSAMRMELVRIVSGRLELSESLAEQLLARGGRREGRAGTPGSGTNGAGGRVAGLPRREEAERAFLALCIASPEQGAQALASLDVDEHFDSELLRRAARWLREGSLLEPFAAPPGGGRLDEDPELQRLMAELVVEAGREESHAAMLEVQRLQLELARVDRQIQRARRQETGDVGKLAERRAGLKREFDTAYGQALEQTGEREG
jgi:DNA primase